MTSQQSDELPPTPAFVQQPTSGAESRTSTDAPRTGQLVVRDTFSMPSSDHSLIEQLRTRAAREGHITNKSEIVRAGLHGLAALDAAQLVILLEKLERIKPGRK